MNLAPPTLAALLPGNCLKLGHKFFIRQPVLCEPVGNNKSSS